MSPYVKATVQSAVVFAVCYGLYYASINGTASSRNSLEETLRARKGPTSPEATNKLYAVLLENANSSRPSWDVRGYDEIAKKKEKGE